MLKKLGLLALVLGFSVVLYSQVNSDSLPEKYVKKVIIEAKWGNGPGEFGLEPLPESYEYMTCFTVSAKGNIYIVDPNNRRINVFNQNGKFIKEIRIPKEFFTSVGKDTIADIGLIGIDSEGFLYLGFASGVNFGFDVDGVVGVKINKDGKVIDKYLFRGIYPIGYSSIYIDEKGEVYLRGAWASKSTKGCDIFIPIRKIKERNITPDEILRSSLQKNRVLKLSGKEIPISTKGLPLIFGIKDSILAYYNGDKFVFQGLDGKIKLELNLYCSYYPRGYGFSYEGKNNIMVNVWPMLDKDLNIYWIVGTPEGLKVIKYIIDKEVWK